MTACASKGLLPLGALALFFCSAGLIGARAADAPPAVTVSPPLQREIVEWEQFTGQFAAVDYVEVRARVSGYLTEIHFEDGQIVKKGDLLFVIDPRPYEAVLASARAQLGQGEAQVDLANRQLKRSAELRKQDFEPASSYDQRVSDLQGRRRRRRIRQGRDPLGRAQRGVHAHHRADRPGASAVIRSASAT